MFIITYWRHTWCACSRLRNISSIINADHKLKLYGADPNIFSAQVGRPAHDPTWERWQYTVYWYGGSLPNTDDTGVYTSPYVKTSVSSLWERR
jgi:hypothetical protein